MLNKHNNKGFTFIELLIVMGLIAVLVSVLIFVVKPGERMPKARDDQKETHLNAIWQAVERKIDQDNGAWVDCPSIPTDAMTAIGSNPDYQYDLYSCIVPDYLSEPLFDALEGYYNGPEDYDTNYRIWRDSTTGRISLRAEGELRYVYVGDPAPPLRLAIGEACDFGTDCETGNCMDEVCCNTACDAICEICNKAGSVGTCVAADAGTDPRDDCGYTDWECTTRCTREQDELFCDGTTGPEACSFAVAEPVEYASVAGNVCDHLVTNDWIAVTTEVFCEEDQLDCDPGACKGYHTYRGCTVGAVSCTTDNELSVPTFTASNNHTLTEDCTDSQNISNCNPCQWCQDGECKSEFSYSRNTPTNITTVAIENQCWMAQSMNVGTRISGGTDQGTSCDTIQKYCYEDTEDNCNPNIQSGYTYPDGGLYQWNQAMCGLSDICPEGWHIPSNTEWEDLLAHLGENPGGQLRPGGSSGFEGNLAGHRNLSGGFAGRGSYAGFWSSSEYDGDTAWYWSLYDSDPDFYQLLFDKLGGFSVRCIQDSS